MSTKTEMKVYLTKIPIYKVELEALQQLKKDEDLIKIFFAILVWSKTTKYGNVPANDREIGKYAGVKKWKDGIAEIIQPYVAEGDDTEGALVKLDYYKIMKKFWRPFYRVLFRAEREHKNPLFYVDSLETCIEDLINNTDIFYGDCLNCGKKFYQRSKSFKYCERCRPEVTKRQKREHIRKVRYEQYKQQREINSR